jgi:hypothetical protein
VEQAETYKVVLHLERRWDGGLRVWSDDVPGLVLSNRDCSKVYADIKPALEFILTEALGFRVEAHLLGRLNIESKADSHLPPPIIEGHPGTLEYAASAAA